MENETLNSTQPTTETSNPQGAAPANGASNAADFQSAATYEALSEQAESLSVQETGEPLPPSGAKAESNNAVLLWAGGVLIVLVSAWLIFKLIRESLEDDKASEQKPASTSKPKAAASRTTKKTAKKTAGKKPTPSHRRKKSSKKRR